MRRRICVFCGSNQGAQSVYKETTVQLARDLARRDIGIVYGAGNVGLMGVLADAALEAGGEVIGVIPRFLVEKEVAHGGLTERHVVESMHERKALMAELSDAFIALPGGFGTFDEFCEILTWAQLGLHRKPCGLLNIAGYYDGLLAMFDHAAKQQFLKAEHRALVLDADDAGTLLERILNFTPPPAGKKWILPGQV